MDKVSTVLSHLIHNPQDIPSCTFLQDIISKEDYVIYFYLMNNYGEGLGFNRDLLDMSLDINAPSWVDERSKMFKEKKMDLDYIRLNVESQLVTPSDYATAFKHLVMRRFDELVSTHDEGFSLSESLPVIKEYAETEMGKNLMGEMVELVRNGKWLNKKKFSQTEIIPYLRARLEEMDMGATHSDLGDTHGNQISDIFASSALTYSQCFEWNLGPNIKLPPVNRGYVVSVIGQEKVGKTKFVLGEMAYNTLRSGGNVLCYSGEMSDVIIRTILIVKHIYATMGYKLDSNKTMSFLKLHFLFLSKGITIEDYEMELKRRQDIRNGKIDEIDKEYVSPELMRGISEIGSDLKMYKAVDEVEKEVILSAYNDLYLTDKYGKFIIYKIEDGVFDIDTLIPVTKANVVKHDAKMWILDHAGFVDSSMGREKTDILTKVYQRAKTIATTDDHPVAAVIVNHIDTKSNTDIKSGKESGKQTLRAHGTSEGNKTADIELALYATPEDSREGLVKLDTMVSRNEKGLSAPVTLVADLAVNDFVGIGSSKQPYSDERGED